MPSRSGAFLLGSNASGGRMRGWTMAGKKKKKKKKWRQKGEQGTTDGDCTRYSSEMEDEDLGLSLSPQSMKTTAWYRFRLNLGFGSA